MIAGWKNAGNFQSEARNVVDGGEIDIEDIRQPLPGILMLKGHEICKQRGVLRHYDGRWERKGWAFTLLDQHGEEDRNNVIRGRLSTIHSACAKIGQEKRMMREPR